MSRSRTSAGGSPRNGASRSSGGTQGRPSASYTPASPSASGNGSSAATYAAEPVARTSSVPKRSGAATTTSIGTPSTVRPRVRCPSRSITATICGSASKWSSTGAGRGAAQTTARCSQESRQRRGSPAASPSSALAIAPTSARA
jgi:hypothetical protein